MTTRQCNRCSLYYPDMIWSHKVRKCPFCGESIESSKKYEYLTAEEKQIFRDLNKEVGLSLTLSEAIKLYKRYRYDRSLLSDEKRYIIEAYWKHCEKEKDKSMSYRDWLFDYCFSKFEEVKDGDKGK